jgi:hypothetical protein
MRSVVILFPVGVGDFLFINLQAGFGSCPNFHSIENKGCFPDINTGEKDAKLIKVKNAWSYTPIPDYVFLSWCCIKRWDTFTFT